MRAEKSALCQHTRDQQCDVPLDHYEDEYRIDAVLTQQVVEEF
jgi:hypothetical protein